MNLNLVIFYDSQMPSMLDYINVLISETELLIPYEVVDETDYRFNHYFADNKIPKFVIFKDGSVNSVISSKIDSERLQNWVNSIIGD